MTQLDERHYAGFRVTLEMTPEGILLTGATELHTSSVFVPEEEATEAFIHPCLYLDDPHLFFKAPPEVAAEDLPVDESADLIPF